MEKYIIIALILLFGVVYYFDKEHDNKIVALEQSSILEMDKNKPKQDSFLKTVVNNLTASNYNKQSKNSYRRPLDSDKSQCSQ